MSHGLYLKILFWLFTFYFSLFFFPLEQVSMYAKPISSKCNYELNFLEKFSPSFEDVVVVVVTRQRVTISYDNNFFFFFFKRVRVNVVVVVNWRV